MTTNAIDLSQALNRACHCPTLRSDLLRRELDEGGASDSLADQLAASRPHLFCASPVFISERDYALMERSVAALHRVASLDGFQSAALQRAGEAAACDFGPQGVFMGYDFHLTAEGPRLIEINTNAGGALLHAAAARAHRACCAPVGRRRLGPHAALDQLDDAWIGMFRAEWQSQRGDAPLCTVAIVDDAPEHQYLGAEFELARRLFESHCIAAVICDPQELQWRRGRLWHPRDDGRPVDLVYNRLTDFDLSQPAHAALLAAYAADAVVLTPHPRAHALHADKRNLVALSDPALLASFGAMPGDVALLRQVVPRTRRVTPAHSDELWAQRRQLFFKPASGYGSKAAYRGDKLTRRVWGEIVAGEFVAQELVPPSERLVQVDGVPTRLKVDVRAYAYAGSIQLLAARAYSGQTTNFRTAGGGFSPVVVLPGGTEAPEDLDESAGLACAC